MYTYGMYRLNEVGREEILARLKQKITRLVEPLPEVEGHRPDLASTKKVYFVAENAEAMARSMAAVRVFAQHGHGVILAIPEQIRDTATEAWDYLPDPEKQRVRILLMPSPPLTTQPPADHQP